MPTYSPKASEIERSWYVVDAEGVVLGRLATEVANVLRGKHKPTYTPHIDTGDHVIIVNADKVVLTANKADTKRVWRHTGFPGGIRSMTYAERLDREPAEAVRATIRGMLPKTRLGRAQLSKLKVYAGPTHPHAAQQPRPLELDRRAHADVATREEFPTVPHPLVQTTGRQKRAVARVRFRPGNGTITVNGRPVDDFFPSRTHRMILTEPLRVTETTEAYDIEATIHGGGQTGQAGALRLGIARGLVALDAELRPTLKSAGFLTRDAREKESKKYGLKKARKAPQYSKR